MFIVAIGVRIIPVLGVLIYELGVTYFQLGLFFFLNKEYASESWQRGATEGTILWCKE